MNNPENQLGDFDLEKILNAQNPLSGTFIQKSHIDCVKCGEALIEPDFSVLELEKWKSCGQCTCLLCMFKDRTNLKMMRSTFRSVKNFVLEIDSMDRKEKEKQTTKKAAKKFTGIVGDPGVAKKDTKEFYGNVGVVGEYWTSYNQHNFDSVVKENIPGNVGEDLDPKGTERVVKEKAPKWCTVSVDYEPIEEGKLGSSVGEVLKIEADYGVWLYCRNQNGIVGLIPANFVEKHK